MNLDDALQTFILESRELLQEMESALLAARGGQARDDHIHAIFRAAHTIKGSAGLFGLDHVVAFTHVVESLLDQLRDGALSIDDTLIALLLSCCDHVQALVERVDGGNTESDAALEARAEPLVAQLRGYLDANPDVARRDADGDRGDSRTADIAAAATGRWHISVRFGADVLRNGMDPLSFLQYLARMGTDVIVATVADGLPALDALDPESAYLGFEIGMHSDADAAQLEAVFEFVREDSAVRLVPPGSPAQDYADLLWALPEDSATLAPLLVQCGSVSSQALEAVLGAPIGAGAQQAKAACSASPSAAVQAIGPDDARRPAAQRAAAPEAKVQESRSIRVDAEKLDHLINLVGELIIAGASANLIARRTLNAELQECTSTLTSLVEDVRASALQLRMVKIGATFNRFQRVVHDVSREIGKDIALIVSGEDTELDKTLVEKIADPLTHLVRNAIDHGIEPAAQRAAAGKPAQGTVRLNAYHDSGSIVIEVSDDGGGLKRERILAKAIERGLVEPNRALSDSEVHALIFEPGFSTAEQITNLSGRGVGMDVVKSNITALRGSVSVHSEPGVGTTVTVRLPLTLAIIDGFLVGVGKTTFVVPLDMIEECIEFSRAAGHDYTNLRGEVLPFIHLRQLFDIAGPAGRRESIVVVKYAGRKAGLVVDTLLGEFQTVIKPLGKMFGQVDCISGSTILGSGEVALIVDVPALLNEKTLHDHALAV